MGRVVLTTQEWNSLQTNGISFKIKAESNQGIWAYPSVPTCQGCKFYYENDSYIYTTWDNYVDTPTVISSGTSDNYLDIISSSGKNFFLGMKLNNSSQITNLYICGFVNNEPYCFEVDQDGSAYETNKRIIQNSNLWNNYCTISITGQGTVNEREVTECPFAYVEETDIDNISISNIGVMIDDANGGFCAGYMTGEATCYDVDPN